MAYAHAPIVEDKATEAITSVLSIEAVVDFSVKYCIKINMPIASDRTANPTNAMAASKRITEIYLQLLNKLICDRDHVFTNGSSNNDRHVAMSIKRIIQEFKSKNRSLRN